MKDIRIRNTPEFEENIRILKEYYDIKTTSKVIRQAVRDCSMVAEIKWLNKMITIEEPDYWNWSDIQKIDVGHNIDWYWNDLWIEFKNWEYEGYSLRKNGK